jgi:hypothetical protein
MHGHNNGIIFLASCGWQISSSAISLNAPRWQERALNISLNHFAAIISNSIDYIALPKDLMKQLNRYLGFEERGNLDCVWDTELPDRLCRNRGSI